MGISYDTNWQSKYQDMIETPAKAVARIKPGQRLFVGTGCAEPVELVSALIERAPELSDVEIIQLLSITDPFTKISLMNSFLINSFFIGKNIREHIQAGLGIYTPILLSDIPALFSAGQIPIDVAMIQVTPPDDRGMMSLGISVDIVKSAASNASLVIALVNQQMPWTMGESCLNVYDFDILVPTDTPILETEPEEVSEEILHIGKHIASLVEDGSTIEFGIGRIPQALTQFLKGKKDLGVHTEMLTDNIVDLLESGTVTGIEKTKDPHKIVVSFCMGTKRLYDYIDQNPTFCFRPTEYVNDIHVIGQQRKMVAINMALEVDLTGQVCADSLGTSFHSGIGGQVDFNRGASRSKGGKAIIALPSTAKKGNVSRIVTSLRAGAGVVTTRGEVHYVVTEFGVAYLHGKSIQDRVLALISIAHPDFREQLFQDAIEAKLLRKEFESIEGTFFVPSQEVKATYLLNNGIQVNFRHIHPTDEPHMRDLMYALTKETVRYRFMTPSKKISHRLIQDFVYINTRKDIAIVGTLPEAHGEDIIAVGRYYLVEDTNRAEVAFVIRDDWQHLGIGKFLFNHLVTIAKRNGIVGFLAEILRDNKGMQSIINHCGYKIKCEPEYDVYSYQIDFD